MGADDPSEDYNFFFQRKSKDDFNSSKIMVIAIISLSIVIILVTFLHLYARCILRRQARRRAALRRHLGVIREVHVHHLEQPKSGLDPSVIASLPIFVFRHSDHSGNNVTGSKSNVECSICLSVLQDGEIIRILPNCKHNFHAECIDKWLESQPTCPICRTEAEPIRLVAEPREGAVGPSVPRFELVTSARLITSTEGSSDDGTSKINGSSSRLNSFRRILNRDRLSWRSHGGQEEQAAQDLERQ